MQKWKTEQSNFKNITLDRIWLATRRSWLSCFAVTSRRLPTAVSVCTLEREQSLFMLCGVRCSGVDVSPGQPHTDFEVLLKNNSC